MSKATGPRGAMRLLLWLGIMLLPSSAGAILPTDATPTLTPTATRTSTPEAHPCLTIEGQVLGTGPGGLVPVGASVRFRYRLTGDPPLRVVLANSKTGERMESLVPEPIVGQWSEATVAFSHAANRLRHVDEIQFLVGAGSELLLDDVLLYEPSGAGRD